MSKLCYIESMKKLFGTKDKLIPLEKSRRIIRLDKRGREDKRGRYGAAVAAILAVSCLFYCLSIIFFMGYGTKFFLIWGFLACAMGVLSVLLWRRDWWEKIPLWIRRSFWLLCVIGAVIFLFVECLIGSQFHAKATNGADYMIILGAQWKSHGPSYVLQKRLDAAIDYLQKNPDTQIIVSGGKGKNEPISEAEGMAAYLENAGIAPQRILPEDQSTNTHENLEFSGQYLDKEQDRVVIVTNNFHVYRALKLAQKKGYVQAEGLAAGSYPAMLPNNLLREFFGVIKDFVCGNI